MDMMWQHPFITDIFALQHRGQESCGIAVTDTAGKRKVLSRKGLGHVNDVFDEKVLSELKGNLGVGHVRYSTAGGTRVENAQPLVINYVKGTLAIAHNGNLVNAIELRKELEYTGAIFPDDDRLGSDRLSYCKGAAGGCNCGGGSETCDEKDQRCLCTGREQSEEN